MMKRVHIKKGLHIKKTSRKKVILYSISLILLLALAVFIIGYFNKRFVLFSPEPCGWRFDECGKLSGAGVIYCISADLIANTTNCININADNIILNCVDHRITGNGTGIKNPQNAIIVNGNNVKIKNCVLENFANSGILVNVSDNNILENIESYNSPYGLIIKNANNNTINSSNIHDNNYSGISIISSNTNWVIDSNFVSNRIAGVNLTNSDYNNIDGSTFQTTDQSGIVIQSSNYNNISNNNIENDERRSSIGIKIDGTSVYNTIFNNEIRSNRLGIYLGDSAITNLFYNNLLINVNNLNVNQASLPLNFWNISKSRKINIADGAFSGGNYWGGLDNLGFSDSPPGGIGCHDDFYDGICDNSFTLVGNNIDYLPLSMFFSSEFYTRGEGCNAYINCSFANWNDDELYCINQSINYSGLNGGACFDITGKKGIIINGRGYTIDGNSSNAHAIKITGGSEDISIINYKIQNFDRSAIYATGVANLSLSTIDINNSGNINITNSNNAVIRNVIIQNPLYNAMSIINSNGFNLIAEPRILDITGGQGIGINIVSSNNSILRGTINLKNQTEENLIIKNSRNVTINQLTARAYNLSKGIKLYGVANSTISGITIYDSSDIGLLISTSKNNKFSTISIYNSYLEGLKINKTSINNTFYNINVLNGANGAGILLKESSSNNLTKITSVNNSEQAIYIDTSGSLVFDDIQAKQTRNGGGIISDGSVISFSRITSQENNGTGIYIINSSEKIIIKNSPAIKKNNGFGIVSDRSSNLFVNNSMIQENALGGIFINGTNNAGGYDNNRIEYSTISSNTGVGISIINSKNNTIKSCVISSNIQTNLSLINSTNGVYLENANDVLIIKTSANLNSYSGFYINNSVNLNMISSSADSNYYSAGIYLYKTNSARIENSSSTSNKYGMILEVGNTINIINTTIKDNYQGAGIINYASNYTTFDRLLVTNNGLFGIKDIGTKDNIITNSTISSNSGGRGIILESSMNAEITFNKIDSNSIGIEIINASSVTYPNKVYTNFIKENSQYGISIIDSGRQSIYNNYFKNNVNAKVENFSSSRENNFWNLETLGYGAINILGITGKGGNYWATPSGSGFSQTCTDKNPDTGEIDHICNDPYNITNDGLNIDYSPITDKDNPLPVTGCNNLSDCSQPINSAGQTYCLNTSISFSSGTCFSVSANNIIFDCKGNSIDGIKLGQIGIFIYGHTGVTLKDCKIYNTLDSAVKISGSNSNTIQNIRTENNTNGIYIINSNLNSISGISSLNDNNGIYLGGYNNTVSGSNSISSSITKALSVAGNNNIISGLTISDSINDAVSLTGTNIAFSSIISNTAGNGITLSGSENILSGSVLNTGKDAVIISSGDSNILTGLTISGTNSTFKDLISSSGTSNTNILDTAIGMCRIDNDNIRLKTSYGEIEFLEPINFEGNLNENIKFSSGNLYINSSNPGLNKSANITFLGIEGQGTRSLIVNGQVCNSTTTPSCTQILGLDSRTISFISSRAGNFEVKGYYWTIDSPEDNRKTVAENITFRFTVHFIPGRNIENCTLIINDALDKSFDSTEVKDGEEVYYKYKILQDGFYAWNLTCTDSANQILKHSSWFNKTQPDPNNGGGNNNGGNNNDGGTRTCSQISGGVKCADDKVCSTGSFTSASDTNRCCVGACISPGSQTCLQKSGVICSDTQTCSTGSFTASSDSSRCCIGGTCAIDVTPTPDCDLMCKINKFFEDRTNLIIVLASIGIIIVLIILIFFYSMKNKSSEKIRIFQDQQRPSFLNNGPQYNPIPARTPTIQPAPQPQQKHEHDMLAEKQKQALINAARLSLRNYILKEMKKGISESELRDVLLKANWKEVEIDSAFHDVKRFINK